MISKHNPPIGSKPPTFLLVLNCTLLYDLFLIQIRTECNTIVFTNDKFSKILLEQNTYNNTFDLPSVSAGFLTLCLDNICPNVFLDQLKASVIRVKTRHLSTSSLYQLHCHFSVLLCRRPLISHTSLSITKYSFPHLSFSLRKIPRHQKNSIGQTLFKNSSCCILPILSLHNAT